MILDCCFAGQAIEALGADGEPGLADIAHVDGVYTLTATTRNRTAHVPPPGQQDTACTSFTGELRDLIRSGIPGKPARLTFGDIYPVLRQRLRAKGLPAPSQRGTDTAYLFPFTVNAAGQVQAHAGPSAADAAALAGHHGNGAGETLQAVQPSVPAGRPEVIRLLDDATRAALEVPGEENKAEALAHVAAAVAAFDPDRATQLINRAEHLLPPAADKRDRDVALAWITTALVTIDPGRAEQLAKSITMDYYQAVALTEVAVAVAAADPDEAEHVASSIFDHDWKATALTKVAIAVAAADPDRAERIAQSVAPGKGSRRDEALAAVAAALAVTDPDRADRIAQSITSGRRLEGRGARRGRGGIRRYRPGPGRAHRRVDRSRQRLLEGRGARRGRGGIRRYRPGPGRANRPLDHLRALGGRGAQRRRGGSARFRPDRSRGLAAEAEGIAGSFATSREKGKAWARFAKALAATDPYEPRSHAGLIWGAESKAAEVLAEAAKVLAATDPDGAEHVASSIFDHHWRATALTEVAKVLAATDPDRAERLAYAVDEVWRPQALAVIAVVLAGYHPADLKFRLTQVSRERLKSANESLATNRPLTSPLPLSAVLGLPLRGALRAHHRGQEAPRSNGPVRPAESAAVEVTFTHGAVAFPE